MKLQGSQGLTLLLLLFIAALLLRLGEYFQALWVLAWHELGNSRI